MTRLTEEMVIARTRASDLTSIRKLNCWGSGLSDVSLLRKMHNVEIISLSVNKIASLCDFQWCPNLKELYVRRNEIRDLNQVCYLRELPRLRSLWLDENPCANCELYRVTVLRALPHLQKLDNQPVEPEEVQEAMRRGMELLHPEDQNAAQQMQQLQMNRRTPTPPQHQQVQQQQVAHHGGYQHQQHPQHTQQGRAPVHERSPPRRQHAPSDPDSEPEGQHGPPLRRGSRLDDEIPYYDTDRRNANYDTDTTNATNSTSNYGRHSNNQYNNAMYEAEDDGVVTRGPQEDRCYRQPPGQLDIGSQQSQCFSRRPVTRNSNILSAVLCLIKELDYPSLEVVEVAVRSRMDEF